MHMHHPDWASHIPVLIKLMQLTDGPVLELGLGIASTPLLHMLCFDKNRPLVSYEHDQKYADMFRKFNRDTQVIKVVADWDDVDIRQYDWDVALIDHKPDERRVAEVQRLSWVPYVVIHDSEPANDHIFGYSKIYPLFKYRYDYTKARTHTTVLSNKQNLNEMKNGER